MLSHLILAQRQYLCLGSSRARVTVDNNGRADAVDEDGTRRAGGKILEGVEPGTDDGWIEVHLLRIPPQVVISIFRGKQMVTSSLRHEGPYDFRPQFFAKLPEEFTTQVLRELEQHVVTLADSLEAGGKLVNSGARIFGEVTRDRLTTLALLPFTHSSAATGEAIKATGFWQIFGHDADFVRKYARVSLLAQTLVPKSEARDLAGLSESEMTTFLERVHALEAQWNCELIIDQEDAIMCNV
jgi:hypothetical protein